MRLYTIVLLFLSVLGMPSLFAADADLRFYTREIVIPNTTAEANLTPCAVFENKDFAFSARWDDSNKNHYRMQALMQKYGFNGTYFLNHKPDQAPMNFQQLKELNADLAAHSMTHARLASELNINRMFWEVAEIRAIVEAEGDQPINSYCFSDGNYRNQIRKHMQGLIAESLQRVGYTHNVGKKFVDQLPEGLDPVSYTYYCTAGNNRNPSFEVFEQNLEKMLAEQEWQEDQPLLSMGVHVWMSNDKHWGTMEKIYQTYAHQENWWYCTQTEYAAYRKLLQQCEISAPRVQGNDIVYTLRLPYGADIGSDIALTLRYSEPVSEILIDGKTVPSRSQNNQTIFNVTPPQFAQIPRLISYQPMAEDPPLLSEEATQTAVSASVSISENHIIALGISANAESQIENLQVRYILPPKYATPSIRTLPPPDAGASLNIEEQLTLIESGEFLWGKPFLLCQIDYLNHGQPERVFTSLFEPTVLPPKSPKYRDSSYASSFFSDRAIWENALPMSQPGAELIPSLDWLGATDEERIIFQENISDIGERLHEELKNRTEEDQYFMIVTEFPSDKEGVLVSKNFKKTNELYLNGQRISPKNGDQLIVKEGVNRLVLLSKVNKFTGRMHHNLSYYVRGL